MLIGVNGVGKSRLLGRIASAFAMLNATATASSSGIKNDGQSSLELSYSIVAANGRTEHIEASVSGRGINRFYVDGRESAISSDLLPSRVLAVTATTFDKFPRLSQTVDVSEYYKYLGLRDPSNRTTIRALVYRTLDSLISFVESSASSETKRLHLLFEMLNFEPTLRARYRFRSTSPLARAAREGVRGLANFLDFATGTLRGNADGLRLKRAIRDGDFTLSELVDAFDRAASDFASDGSEKYILFDLDFGSSGARLVKDRLASRRDMRLLRRAGVLELHNVLLRRGGLELELLEASSGELSLMLQLLGLASSIRPGSLILIDEPEVGLHPEWQQKYLELARLVFARMSDCHFIVATHSPQILGDMTAPNSQVVSLDGRSTGYENALLGESADFILVNAFGVVNPRNYYLRDTVARALNIAATGEFTSEYRSIVRHLRDLRKRLEPGAMRDIIDQLVIAPQSNAKT